MIIFSIIIPTRKRVPLLFSLFKSIEDTTENISAIEVIVVYDEDDLETKEALSHYRRDWLRILSRPRVPNVSDYYNWAYPFTLGRFIWAINDDAEIVTHGWDRIIFDKMKDCEIGFGNLCCPHYDIIGQDAPFNYFPLLTRATVERLGYILPNGYPGWGADAILWDIFSQTNKIIDLKEVKMKHISGRKLKDECYNHMELITPKNEGVNIRGESLKLMR